MSHALLLLLYFNLQVNYFHHARCLKTNAHMGHILPLLPLWFDHIIMLVVLGLTLKMPGGL